MKSLIINWIAIWKKIVFNPKGFYSSLPKGKNIKESLIFALVIWLITHLFMSLITIAKFANITQGLVEFSLLGIILPIIIGVIVGGCFFVLGLYIWAWIFNYLLRRFGGKANFNDTFNIVAYATAVTVFGLLSWMFMGNIVLLSMISIILIIWYAYIIYIGSAIMHDLTHRNAFKAVSIPIIICLVLFSIRFVSSTKDLKSAKLKANESAARATVLTLSVGAETYRNENGVYPLDEDEVINFESAYSSLSDSYNNKTIEGYYYSLQLNSDGYKIIATPAECGITGNKVFVIETEAKQSEYDCQ